jgi:hypothetical protein
VNDTYNESILMQNKTTKMSNLSLTNKILIISFLIATIVIVYYFNVDAQKSTIKFSVSSLTKISYQCSLSMKESDDWFCESDSDWKRRKSIHHIQDRRNRISDARLHFFQNNWEPTMHCEFEQRIGNTGDGGKWVCDTYRFKQNNNTNILVYSFGSNGEFSFESAIKAELSTAEIHTFDVRLYKCPDNICMFHQGRLGDGKSDNSKSLQMIMNELGHQKRQIDLLKVDIEGSEFKLFEELFSNSTKTQTNLPYIRQILFEIHLFGPNAESSRQTHKLFELFRSNNYVIFHKEVNLNDPANVFEYALLKLNPAFFIFPF